MILLTMARWILCLLFLILPAWCNTSRNGAFSSSLTLFLNSKVSQSSKSSRPIIFPSVTPKTTTVKETKKVIENESSNTVIDAATTEITSTEEPIIHETTIVKELGVEPDETTLTKPLKEVEPETTNVEAIKVSSKEVNDKKCKSNEGYDPLTNKCYILASQGPCRVRQWWIIVKGTDTASCQYRLCPQFYAEVAGRCVSMINSENTMICDKGQRLYHNKHGEPRCDCKTNYLIWEGTCYAAYSQGPCKDGQHIRFNNTNNRVECQRNPCKIDGQVLWEGRCLVIGEFCGETKEKNIYINPETLEVGCYEFFRLPKESCQKGSALYAKGEC